MEARLPTTLGLLMWDRPASARPGAALVAGDEPESMRFSSFDNANRGRIDLPRTLPEFTSLTVVENPSGPAPQPAAVEGLVGAFTFERTPRPGQGSLTDEATNGLQLVLISPKDPAAGQDLRDWADFVHIRHIAEAAVPGFRMITPYVNISDEGPRFLHFYEMHTDDPEAAFQDMTPRVAKRLGGRDSDAFAAWAWHPELRIDYVNTFRRVH